MMQMVAISILLYGFIEIRHENVIYRINHYILFNSKCNYVFWTSCSEYDSKPIILANFRSCNSLNYTCSHIIVNISKLVMMLVMASYLPAFLCSTNSKVLKKGYC